MIPLLSCVFCVYPPLPSARPDLPLGSQMDGECSAICWLNNSYLFVFVCLCVCRSRGGRVLSSWRETSWSSAPSSASSWSSGRTTISAGSSGKPESDREPRPNCFYDDIHSYYYYSDYCCIVIAVFIIYLAAAHTYWQEVSAIMCCWDQSDLRKLFLNFFISFLSVPPFVLKLPS